MLAYCEEDLLSDADIMASMCSTENFGLSMPELSTAVSQGYAVNDSISMFRLIQQHSDCIRFLTFAEQSINAESAKSSFYNHILNDDGTNRATTKGHTGSSTVGKSKLPENFSRSDLATILPLLPLSIDVSEINSSGIADVFAVSSSSDRLSLKQLRKDVERDRFLVNGAPVIGSQAGLEGVSSTIVECCSRALSRCCLQPVDRVIENDIAVEVLSKASRTNSGGIAYQCLSYLIEPSGVVIIPVSTLAKPLSISISVGSFADHTDGNAKGDNKWGLVCRVECSTFFTLQSSGGMTDCQPPQFDVGSDASDVIVEIMFEDSICIAVNPCNKYSVQNIAEIHSANANNGLVTVRRYIK